MAPDFFAKASRDVRCGARVASGSSRSCGVGSHPTSGIARELVAIVPANVTIGWTVRENIRAHLRVLVKRILRKHGYPPGKQEKATQTALDRAEVPSKQWAVA